jgi:hypothetical protein
MTLSNLLAMPAISQRQSTSTSDEIRRRALERLYQRKAAVDELIESLENYQRCRVNQGAVCVPFNATPTCS